MSAVNDRITTVPAYLAFTVHPSKKLTKVLDTINSSVIGLINYLEMNGQNNPEKMKIVAASIVRDELGAILPPQTVGYMLAVRFIEKNLLKKDPAKMSADELLNAYQMIGMAVNNDIKTKWVYRNLHVHIWNSLVFPRESNRSQKSFQEMLDKPMMSSGTAEEKAIWKTLRAKIWKAEFGKEENRVNTPYTKEEAALLGKFFAVTVADVTEVPQKMNQFMKELSIRLKDSSEDPYMLMAWIHNTLVAIHPNSIDGNGRSARLFMTWIGMSKGIQPIRMDKDKNYVAAIMAGDKGFSDYLRERSENQLKFQETLCAAFKDLYENTVKENKLDQRLAAVL